MIAITNELRDRLNAIRYTGGYAYQGYNSDTSEQPINFNQDGIEMRGFNPNLHRVLRYERPAHISALMSQLSIITSASPKYQRNNGDAATVDAVLADASRTVTLRRLTQKQKDYILDWIYSGCRAFGRNDHEAAVMVPTILGGYNSFMLYSEKPFSPTLGAMGKAMRTLQYAVSVFQALGAYKGQNVDELVMQIMLEAGVDAGKIKNVTYASILQRQLAFDRAANGVKRWLHDVAEALYAVDPDARNHVWDLEDLRKATKRPGPMWGGSPFSNTYSAVFHSADSLALSWSTISYDPEPLTAMLPTLMEDVANHIKRRNKQYG